MYDYNNYLVGSTPTHISRTNEKPSGRALSDLKRTPFERRHISLAFFLINFDFKCIVSLWGLL